MCVFFFAKDIDKKQQEKQEELEKEKLELQLKVQELVRQGEILQAKVFAIGGVL